MIRDVVIIKDGMPILSKNFSRSTNAFTQADNLIMLSGFFSAIHSFSDQFEDLGNVSELKLSKNDLKLSFLVEPSMPNLVYLATFDEKSKGVNVQRTLRKISKNFLRQYNIQKILNWRGRKDTFQAFEEIIEKHIEEEKEESETDFTEKVVNLFNDVKDKIDGDKKEQPISKPHFYDLIPQPKISKKINPSYYLTGKNSCAVFKIIDGTKNIEGIAQQSEMNPENVYNICKNLVKLGFISLDPHN